MLGEMNGKTSVTHTKDPKSGWFHPNCSIPTASALFADNGPASSAD